MSCFLPMNTLQYVILPQICGFIHQFPESWLFTCRDENGEATEALKPKLTFNPYLQRLYQVRIRIQTDTCIEQTWMKENLLQTGLLLIHTHTHMEVCLSDCLPLCLASHITIMPFYIVTVFIRASSESW